jgi:RNA polymerase sigma factor (sigma-70 family)
LDPARGTLAGRFATIARNLATKRAMSRARHHDEALATEMAAALLDHGADPASDCERNERQEQVQAILTELDSRFSEPSRRIVVLHWAEGRTVPEIAAALGMSKDCVKKRLRRARLWLHARLQPSGLAAS